MLPRALCSSLGFLDFLAWLCPFPPQIPVQSIAGLVEGSSPSVTSPIWVCLEWDAGEWGSLCRDPWKAAKGEQGLGVSYGTCGCGVCGVCARAMSCWLRTGVSPPATTSLLSIATAL